MFYYQHHIGDFLRDTSRLTDSQCMAYLRLLWIYYDTEKPLPNQPEKLAFQIGANATDVGLILDHYFQLDGETYRHSRCDAEIAKYHEKSDISRKAANARWKNADAMRTHSDRKADAPVLDANREPRTENQSSSTKKRERGSRLSPDTELTPDWEAFCRKERPDLNPVETFAKFKDFWMSKAGAGATKLDWTMTWRNWVRNEKVQPNWQQGGMSKGAQTMAALTRGMTLPKQQPVNFWEQPVTETVEVVDVPRKRLL